MFDFYAEPFANLIEEFKKMPGIGPKSAQRLSFYVLGLPVSDVEKLAEYDFIAAGGPTHILRTSKAMKEFLEKLRNVDLKGLKGFSFDTRNESRMNHRSLMLLENSAARVIEGVLKRKKVYIVKTRCSALVEGRGGPLFDGMKERFRRIGTEIAELIH